MIEKSKRRMDQYSSTTIINDYENKTGKSNPSSEELLEFILGDTEGWHCSDYAIYRYNDKPNKTLMNRINLLWIYPLFTLTIPIQWLIRGEIGVNRNSRIGKVIGWLVGWD